MDYKANIYKNNHENEDKRIEKDYIHNGCVYNNIDNKKQNLILQLLLIISNIKAKDLSLYSISSLVIFYYSDKPAYSIK